MKKLYLVVLVVLVATLQACSESAEPPAPVPANQPQSTAGASSGRVSEVIEVDSYVYLNVESGKESAWIATSPSAVRQGDNITFQGGMLMENFHSNALDRTFEKIYFVDSVTVTNRDALEGTPPANETRALPPGHPAVPVAGQELPLPAGDIQPLEGGMTVADIYAAYPGIDGQQVSLRASVVKFSSAIMGANWVTLQDGSGIAPENILVIKTNETVGIGETVTVTGTAKVDVSLGYGYDYKVLMENAQFVR